MSSLIPNKTNSKPISSSLNRVLVEVTSRCNLNCEFCIRNSWKNDQGDMTPLTTEKMLQDLAELSPKPEIQFGGYGEPLLHPEFLEIIARTNRIGARTSLVTNGTLLTRGIANQLVKSGLDRIWISVDIAHQDSFQAYFQADYREHIACCLEVFRENKNQNPTGSRTRGLEIGLSIVVTRQNLPEVLELITMGRILGVDSLFVTSPEIYSEEMAEKGIHKVLSWDLAELTGIVAKFKTEAAGIPLSGSLVDPVQMCPFALKAELAIRWDGEISPCLPLLYDHTSYLGRWQHQVYAYSLGNLQSASLSEIWQGEKYTSLRDRLLAEDFSPCYLCRDCWFSQDNLQDCMGFEHPTCGGCLWAQGLVACP